MQRRTLCGAVVIVALGAGMGPVVAVAAPMERPKARAATVQLGESIAGVRIGMRPPGVRWLWGQPDSVRHVTKAWGRVVRYGYRARRLTVMFERRRGAWRVAHVRTQSRSDRTAAGLGVGSRAAAVYRALKREQCDRDHWGRWCQGLSRGSAGVDVFTLFRLSRGRVTSVSLARAVHVQVESPPQ